jgi:hypothetical protein
MIAWLKRSLSAKIKEQRGAYTIEFLAVISGLLLLIMIIIQVLLSLMQGIVFNHALSLAAQQAAARGGSDPGVVNTFESHLMPGMKVPSGGKSLFVFKTLQGGAVPSGDLTYGNLYSTTGGNGRELTRFGEIFCVQGYYKPINLPLNSILGISGPSNPVISKQITVSSQSSRDTTTSSLNNQGCS